MCINLSTILKSKYIMGEYSRLIIDLNRDKSDPTLIQKLLTEQLLKNIILNENDKKDLKYL